VKILSRSLATIATLAVAATLAFPQPVSAATAAELTRDAQAALNSLYAKNPGAKSIGKGAVAVLVFPSIVKATVKDKIYAFIFNQSGAMVGIGIQGNKITKIKK
jgi:hypothetical protein